MKGFRVFVMLALGMLAGWLLLLQAQIHQFAKLQIQLNDEFMRLLGLK